MEENKNSAQSTPAPAVSAPAASASDAAASTHSTPAPKKSNKIVLIVVGCMVLAVFCIVSVLGVLAYMGMKAKDQRNDKGNKPTPTQVKEETPEEEADPTPIKTVTTDVEFTTQFLGLNSLWAPVALTVSRPTDLYLEFPKEYGDVSVELGKGCKRAHIEDEVVVKFDNSDVELYFYSCEFTAEDVYLVDTYNLDTADGHEVNVQVFDDASGNGIYTVWAFDLDVEIFVKAEFDEMNYDDQQREFDLLIKSIELN